MRGSGGEVFFYYHLLLFLYVIGDSCNIVMMHRLPPTRFYSSFFFFFPLRRGLARQHGARRCVSGPCGVGRLARRLVGGGYRTQRLCKVQPSPYTLPTYVLDMNAHVFAKIMRCYGKDRELLTKVPTRAQGMDRACSTRSSTWLCGRSV